LRIVIKIRAIALLAVVLTISAVVALGQSTQAMLEFTVSMPQPQNHTFHVTLRATGMNGNIQDFKMPVWTPGYYVVGNYARNVSSFSAEDGSGRALPWEKVSSNTWRVASDGERVIVLHYDVYGDTWFAADSYLDVDRAYLLPSGVFLYMPGMIRRPVTVKIQLPPNWKQIATGLEPLTGKANVFVASNYDVLYDSPILMGNQERLQFDVEGVPHYVVLEDVPASVDRTKMLADLKRMVTSATRLIGAVPYKHYTFLLTGHGRGGIEHLNSASIEFDGNGLLTPKGYLGWLSYVSHEYFHNFNVKRIRPIALGPFNYDMANLTDMLWVSEGLTVYYQDIVLVRAGLMTRDQYLNKMAKAIASFENAQGHHYQSATESSLNTWNSSSGIGGDRNTTISYYDDGAMLGAMLDLKIREASENRKSLDDVMRGLYETYYLQKHRGFTDAEFRQACESAAGADLSEVFSYASTTTDVNYAKYFAYAGLNLVETKHDAPGAYLGIDTHTEELSPDASGPETASHHRWGPSNRATEVRLVITSITPGSPAEAAGLRAGDEILEVEGRKATPQVINDLLMPHESSVPGVATKQPGDKITIRISRSHVTQDVEVALGKNFTRTYTLQPVNHPTALQRDILKSWLPTMTKDK